MTEINQIETPPPEISIDSTSTRKDGGSYATDVVKLVTGTTIAQLLAVLSSPLLSRLFLPDTFGTYSLYLSITNIISRISCLRYEMAIMLPDKDEEGINLMGVGVFFSGLFALLSIPLMLLGRDWLANLLRAPDIAPYLWMIPLTIFFGGVSLALNMWNSRTHQFGRLAKRRVLSALVQVSIPLIGGLLGWVTSGALIFGYMMGIIIATVVLAMDIWQDDRVLMRTHIRWQSMKDGIVRYKKFPLYDTGATLLNVVSWQLPTLMLQFFFSSSVVGWYGFGNRILRMPMDLIGNSIAQAFFPQAAEAYREGRLAIVVEKTFERLVKLSLLPLLVLSIIGKDAFHVVFGGQWDEAGVYTQILSLWMFFWFISSPMGQLFRLLEKQEFSLRINIYIFVTRFLSLLVGGLLKDARLALFLFAISGVLTYGYLSISILVLSKVSGRKILAILMKNFLVFMPAGAILLAMVLLHVPSLITLLVGGVYVGIYYVLLLRNDKELAKIFFKSAWGKRFGWFFKHKL